jgi:hypothetical protein
MVVHDALNLPPNAPVAVLERRHGCQPAPTLFCSAPIRKAAATFDVYWNGERSTTGEDNHPNQSYSPGYYPGSLSSPVDILLACACQGLGRRHPQRSDLVIPTQSNSLR